MLQITETYKEPEKETIPVVLESAIIKETAAISTKEENKLISNNTDIMKKKIKKKVKKNLKIDTTSAAIPEKKKKNNFAQVEKQSITFLINLN